jgi:hypothetical protein
MATTKRTLAKMPSLHSPKLARPTRARRCQPFHARERIHSRSKTDRCALRQVLSSYVGRQTDRSTFRDEGAKGQSKGAGLREGCFTATSRGAPLAIMSGRCIKDVATAKTDVSVYPGRTRKCCERSASDPVCRCWPVYERRTGVLAGAHQSPGPGAS